ncbi:MAG TPA: carboxypeptidase-like regulatory domain-containing protein [Bryobacteraceae bacterium]|jgi:hypothetical protein|nr:carboxypeptidase-like regulatory domain-containing protein [Bryobacteraceae bacterium]
MSAHIKQTWILTLAAGALHAASIHGTVVENQTGYPIARAIVTAQPAKAGAQAIVIRSNLSGIFDFPSLPAGTYRISAAKAGFAPVQYGQKRWYSPGMPIALADGDAADLTIRMPRFGGISGTLLDENEVGLQDAEVAVYANTRPPRLLGRAVTDDRGIYRLGSMRPGTYLVRSIAKVYDDETYLPTFYRDSPVPNESHAIEVKFDEEVEHMDFHASPGRLFTVSGEVNIAFGRAVLSLLSDMGAVPATVDANGRFTFPPVAPGQYELLAAIPDDRARGRSADFQTLTVDRDVSVRVNPTPLPKLQFAFADTAGQPLSMPEGSVLLRRKDPAGEGDAVAAAIGTGFPLMPGRWEVAVRPGATYCAVGIEPKELAGRADGWTEILLAPRSQTLIRFVLSLHPAIVGGTVTNANGDPVAGVPVFVEPFDLDPRLRIEPLRSVTTDGKGRYEISGLAAGVYRLMASFDYEMPDASQMAAANAKKVQVDDGGRATLDLQEFVIR